MPGFRYEDLQLPAAADEEGRESRGPRGEPCAQHQGAETIALTYNLRARMDVRYIHALTVVVGAKERLGVLVSILNIWPSCCCSCGCLSG